MTTDDMMDIKERYVYVRRMKRRYHDASDGEKTCLLEEMCAMTGMHRKSLIRLMNRPEIERRKRRQERGRVYSAHVDDAIRVIGAALDWVCAERLAPSLPGMAQHLSQFGVLEVNDTLLQELTTISVSTVGRIMQRVRQDEHRLPQRRGRPKYPKGVAAQVPVAVIPWNEAQPGHFEVDTVIHSDDDPRGDCVCTLQWIDVATAWSERTAIYGRSELEVHAAFQHIVQRCPIPILELHPDNGPEFMNAHLLRFFSTLVKGAYWTRSRTYHKNDNRFVEQKNGTLVRAYLGNAPLKAREQRDLLNMVYEDMWHYYNLFQPVLRQVSRETTFDDLGIAHIHRKHDRAQTPFERLVTTKVLADAKRQHLTTLRDSLNPIHLRESIEDKLGALFRTIRT